MEDLLWQVLGERYGADCNDPSTWHIDHVTGLQPIKAHPVFDAIGSAAVIAGIDELLGPGTWQKPGQWGQFLITFPGGQPWNVPIGWHTDFDFTVSTDVVHGLMVFSFLGDVGPRGGGTAVLASSHRLIQRFLRKKNPRNRARMKTVRKAFLESDPWLADLDAAQDRPGRIEKFMESTYEIDGISLQVKELTGDAGDVVIGHPWLLHAVSPNCGNRPRFMRVQRVHLHVAA